MPDLSEALTEGLDDGDTELVEARAAEILAPLGSVDPPAKPADLDELRRLGDWFNQGKGRLEQYFVCAMVCSGPSEPSVDRFQAIVLEAVLYDLDQGDRPPGVPMLACRRIRQLHQEEHDRPELERKCDATRPVIGELDLNDKETTLEELVETREHLRRDNSLAYDFLGVFESLLKRHVKDEVRTRDSEIRPVRHSASSPLSLEGDSATGADGGVGIRHDCYDDRKTKADDVEHGNTYLENSPEGPNSHKGSLDVQKYRATAATSSVIRTYMLSPMRWGVLSKRSLGELVRGLRSGVAAGSRVDALLTISLLTGRPFSTVSDMPIRDRSLQPGRNLERDVLLRDRRLDGWLALRSGLVLTSPDDHGQCYLESSPTLEIRLPNEIARCLESGPGTSSRLKEKTVETRLEELRCNCPQITLPRIASAGYQWSYHNGVERTLLDRLFGSELSHAVPLFYERMSAARVLDAYSQWFDFLNGLIKTREHRFTLNPPRKQPPIGSRLNPDLKTVSDLLRNFRSMVRWQLKSGQSFRRVHNFYVVYTYLTLSFATSLRPVRQAFESFSDFCDQTNSYFILDKDSRRSPAPRFVPLAPSAAEQLRNYRSYLLDMQNYLQVDDRSKDYIEKVLQGRNPYLFTLDEASGRIRPLTPADISKILGMFFPLILNCNRHLLRTYLIEHGDSDEVVQAIMGHGDMGQSPFARYSALSTADLEDAKAVVEKMIIELGFAPLAHSTAKRAIEPELTVEKRKGHVSGVFLAQRTKLARQRRKQRLKEIDEGRQWVAAKLAEARNGINSLQDDNRANEWQKTTISELDKALRSEYGWCAARHALSKGIEALNERFNLNLPVVAPPRRLSPPPPMRNQEMFDALRVVQKAASTFVCALSKPVRISQLKQDSLLALVLFSAACFGGLTDPNALLALARRLQSDSRLRLTYVRSLDLCWLELVFNTKKRNNIVIRNTPKCMRRFFLDGTTLLLLTRFLKTPYQSEISTNSAAKVMSLIRSALGELRAKEGEDSRQLIPKSMTLFQFTRGAINVAENQPGVRLPHYLAEFACGVIDSVSLPEPYFRHYLGALVEVPADHEALPRVRTQPLKYFDGEDVGEVGDSIRKVKSLFAGIERDRKDAYREELLRRMNALLSAAEGQPQTLELLVRWLRDRVSKKLLKPQSARRYSDWISSGWLIQFDGVRLEELSAEAWYDRYTALIELLPENQRPEAAGRIDSFHRFLADTVDAIPMLPAEMHRSYRKKELVRPRLIPERTFEKYKVELLSSNLEDAKKACIFWIFVLCFRLGTRIGETTRMLLADIEDGDDPIVMFKSNRFGSTKTSSPQQLKLRAFLSQEELLHFRMWLEERRRYTTSETELVFAPPYTTAVTWDTRDLGSLFTALMERASGLHFSPHDCRHSAASRLIWLAEAKDPPDVLLETEKERQKLKDAVFTEHANCRDRIWHLSAAFGHASPETTLGSYVHLLDLLLRRHLERNSHRMPAQAIAEILDCPKRRLAKCEHVNENGFLIEKVFPVVYGQYGSLFEAVEVLAPQKAQALFATEGLAVELGALSRVERVQVALEDVEKGEDPDLVAITHDMERPDLERLVRRAKQLRDLKTRSGVSRLFSKSRLNAKYAPIAPGRLRLTDDQRLASKLIPSLLAAYERDRELIREACTYWLTHTTTSRAEIRFHSPSTLRKFLRCFVETGAVPNDKWLIVVSPRLRDPARDFKRAWMVFPGVEVRVDNTVRRARSYGIAALHLRSRGQVRGRKSEDSSQALRYVMHLLCIFWDIGPDEESDSD